MHKILTSVPSFWNWEAMMNIWFSYGMQTTSVWCPLIKPAFWNKHKYTLHECCQWHRQNDQTFLNIILKLNPLQSLMGIIDPERYACCWWFREQRLADSTMLDRVRKRGRATHAKWISKARFEKYTIPGCNEMLSQMSRMCLMVSRMCGYTLAPASHSYPNHSLWHTRIVGFHSSLQCRQMSPSFFSSSFAKREMAQNVPLACVDQWHLAFLIGTMITGIWEFWDTGSTLNAKIWQWSLHHDAAYEGGDFFKVADWKGMACPFLTKTSAIFAMRKRCHGPKTFHIFIWP